MTVDQYLANIAIGLAFGACSVWGLTHLVLRSRERSRSEIVVVGLFWVGLMASSGLLLATSITAHYGFGYFGDDVALLVGVPAKVGLLAGAVIVPMRNIGWRRRRHSER